MTDGLLDRWLTPGDIDFLSEATRVIADYGYATDRMMTSYFPDTGPDTMRRAMLLMERLGVIEKSPSFLGWRALVIAGDVDGVVARMRSLPDGEVPPLPNCSTCRDTGKVECAEPDGSGLYDQACPDCDAPYPVTGDPDAEDPFAPASPSQTTPRGTEQ